MSALQFKVYYDVGRSADPNQAQQGVDRDFEVEKKAHIANIEFVLPEFSPYAIDGVVRRIGDLREACDSRTNRNTLAIVRNVRDQLFDNLRPLGPRPYQRHFAAPNNKELREFVDM